MSEYKVICPIGLFYTKQQICIADSNDNLQLVEACGLDDFGKTVSEVCNKYDIDQVYLLGDKKFCDALVDDILSYNKTHYNFRDLKIEVK